MNLKKQVDNWFFDGGKSVYIAGWGMSKTEHFSMSKKISDPKDTQRLDYEVRKRQAWILGEEVFCYFDLEGDWDEID